MKSSSIESIIHESIHSNFYQFDDWKNNIWVIGDVHGCDIQFEDLLEDILDEDQHAIVFQLGDMIDRGPGMLECYQIAADYCVNLLVGNHEMNFLAEHFGIKECNSKHRKNSHDLFDTYNKEDQDFILEMMCKSMNKVDVQINYLSNTLSTNPRCKMFTLTHAPYNMNKEYDINNGWDFCKNNVPCDEEYLQKLSKQVFPWYNIHGHQHWNYTDVVEQVKTNRGINIDGGCAYGKDLIALRLNDFKVLKVENPIDYSVIK